MNEFIIVFGVCILVLIILLVIIPLSFYKKGNDSDDFLDENGNHRYYDRSIIEKEKFLKDNPKVSERDLRTWRRFFKNFNTHKR